MLQQRRDVLADVVLARAFPVALGVLLVVSQGAFSDLLQIFRTQWHATTFHAAQSSNADHPWQTRGLVQLIAM